jgi:alpha-L-rhamnosidase
MAGRWMVVEGLGYAPEIEDLRGYLITNDRERTGFFECADPLFNQIYESDLATYIANTVNGVTMDCPHRERYGYGEVALACSWGPGIPNYESAAYYQKVIQDWIDVQRDDGFVNTIAPQVYRGAGGALWSSAPVTLAWEFYRAYGDLRQLETSYASMKKWVDYLHEYVSEEGVLTAYESPSRFLGDWATPHGSEYGNTEAAKLFNNCVYAYCLELTAKSARALGRDDEAALYQQRLAALRPSVHRKWYNEATGLYHDGRQLSLAFPLFVGVTPEPLRESVLEKFITEIKTNKPYLDTGSSGLPILLKFVVDHLKRPDLIHHCLQSTEMPSYGYFLKRGQTTWPEYWEVDDIPSRIHTCYTGISGWFVRGVAGIQPDPEHPGMQSFRIEPKLVGDLEWAKARSASLYGTIVSEWSRQGNEAVFVVELPPNTSATLVVPSLAPEAVREGRMLAAEAEGVTALGAEDGTAVFKVGSGRYRFTSRVR